MELELSHIPRTSKTFQFSNNFKINKNVSSKTMFNWKGFEFRRSSSNINKRFTLPRPSKSDEKIFPWFERLFSPQQLFSALTLLCLKRCHNHLRSCHTRLQTAFSITNNSLRVHLNVCVCKWERDIEKVWERESFCVCLCVCVLERERGRKIENKKRKIERER